MEILTKKSSLLIVFCSVLISCQPNQTPEEKRIADSLAIREKFDESPVLSPEESLERIHIEDGFEVRLVAAEPLVHTPVTMTFDERGRIWVVEMSNYMPDTAGTGEDKATGKIVILEDTDGDGRMDQRSVFMDSLVLPRAICLIDGGVLVAEPPNLWFVENNNGVAGKKTLVDPDYAVGGNVEHQPNGLYRALDNWIYNAKSARRYRKTAGGWLIEPTVFRGQWGISQDDQGRLFYNHNSANLLGDYFPPRFGAENPSQGGVAGYSQRIVRSNRVYPIRPNTGINRGYRNGALTDSLRLVNFTAASGPVIYRGGLLGDGYQGNAFVPEPSANLVKRDVINSQVNRVSGEPAYENKEFLASTDERFRPVSASNGPDGALYLVDMYRGIIQHVTYLTDYLKNEIKMRELSDPLNLGRIYKVVPKGANPKPLVFPSDTKELVALLNHPNGWVRDKAQQLLVDQVRPESIPLLREKLTAGRTQHGAHPAAGQATAGQATGEQRIGTDHVAGDNAIGLVHALWTLEGLDALRWEDLQPLLESGNEMLVAQALTAIPSVTGRGNASDILNAVKPLAANEKLAPYVAFLLPSLQPFASAKTNRFLMELAQQYANDKYVADAVISNLNGKEADFMKRLNKWSDDTTLVVKKRLKEVLKDIREKEQARLKQELLKELSRGAELFKSICQACHGADGKGIASMAPPLNRSEWVVGDKHRLAAIVLFGLTGPVEVNGHVYDQDDITGEMPGIGNNDALSDDDIAQILSFVRNAWNNEAGLVTADDIGQVRETLKDQKGAFTIGEVKQLSF